jgi:hypothetical protein
MDSAKPRLYRLVKYRGESYEGFIGSQKPFDQRGVNPIAKIASPPLYIEGKPLFRRVPSIVTKILLLDSHQGGGNLLHTSTKSKEEEGARGCRPQGQPPLL